MKEILKQFKSFRDKLINLQENTKVIPEMYWFVTWFLRDNILIIEKDMLKESDAYIIENILKDYPEVIKKSEKTKEFFAKSEEAINNLADLHYETTYREIDENIIQQEFDEFKGELAKITNPLCELLEEHDNYNIEINKIIGAD